MTIILTVFFIFIILILFLISPATPRPEAKFFCGKMYAHRGLQGKGAPENSIAAFRRARAEGFGVELDVRLSADGKAVVFHDSDLLRMCASNEEVRDLTTEQLSHFHLLETEERVPTLREALEALGGVPVICEIKVPADPRELSTLCTQAEKDLRTYAGKYCVESFSPFAVRWFYKHAPDIVRGQLAESAARPSLSRILAANLCFNFLSRPDFVAYNCRDTRPPGFQTMRLFGIPLVAWTIRSEEELTKAEKIFDSFIFEKE